VGIAGETSRDREIDATVRGRLTPRADHPTAGLTEQAATGVVRPRLVALLDVALRQRLTLVVAPPGYGKSVALSHWRAARPDEVRWLGLTPADNDPARFAMHLHNALGDVGTDPHVRPEEHHADPHTDLRRDPLGEPFVSMLRDAVAETAPIALVLDDLHCLTNVDLVAELAALIDRAPDDLHFVVASEIEPPINYYKLRWSEALIGLNQDDLAFTRTETRELLRAWDVEVRDDDLADLVAATEGWATGLRLVADHIGELRGREISPESLTTAPIGIEEYFSERVLSRQSPSVVRFMLATSVLHRMNGPLCDRLVGVDDAQATLEELERRSMFTTGIESRRGWFRYHVLLRATLREALRRQDRHLEHALLMRAAEWHLVRDDDDIGVSYLSEAGAWNEVFDVVVRHAGSMLTNDRATTVATWLARVPLDVVRTRRDIRLVEAAAMLFGGRPGDVVAVLDDVEGQLEATPTERVIVSLLRAHRALQQGLGETALSEAGKVLEHIDDVDEDSMPGIFGLTRSRDDLLAGARLASGLARFYRGDFVDARFDLAPVVATSHATWQVATLSALSLLDAWCGALVAAERLARQAISMAMELGTDRYPIAHARIALACVACSRGQLEEADAMLEAAAIGMDSGRRRVADAMIRLGHAEVAAARGDADAALAILGNMAAEAQPVASPLVAARQLALRGQLLMAVGDDDTARRAIDSSDLSGYELDAVRVRLAVADGDLLRARALIDRMPDRPEPRAPLARLLWSAVLDWLEGRETASQLALGTVVAATEPEGDIALFRTAGTFALTPTRALFRAAPTPFLRMVIDNLAALASPRPRATRRLVEQLTEREYNVLTLLPTRLSSAEIAGRLGISLNTVKTHLKHLYRKLGVSGRNEAVAEAERLHLL
jgi:LuxR family maltose regulon positive regulatory protein